MMATQGNYLTGLGTGLNTRQAPLKDFKEWLAAYHDLEPKMLAEVDAGTTPTPDNATGKF